MFTQGLDHFTIWTADPDATRRFYCGILGLTEGKRPDLGFPGMWLYAGAKPVVHVNFGDKLPGDGANAFDHVAFSGIGDPEPLVDKLKAEGVTHKAQTVGGGIRQVFCVDPQGVRVEFNFPPA